MTHARSRGTDAAREEEAPSSQRLVSFSDGVIAIAITLLALQLSIPVIKDPTSGSQLGHALWANRGQFRIYLITFVVIGYYWMIHHRTFRVITGHDAVLAWVNMVFLLGISVLPFGSNLFGRYTSNTTAMMVYGGIFTVLSLSFVAIAFVAEWRRLLDSRANLARFRSGRARAIGTTLVFGMSVALAPLTGPGDAQLLWLVIIAIVLFARVHERRVPSA